MFPSEILHKQGVQLCSYGASGLVNPLKIASLAEIAQHLWVHHGQKVLATVFPFRPTPCFFLSVGGRVIAIKAWTKMFTAYAVCGLFERDMQTAV